MRRSVVPLFNQNKMLKQEITFDDLNILPSEIYEQMGYGDAVPDAAVQAETSASWSA